MLVNKFASEIHLPPPFPKKINKYKWVHGDPLVHLNLQLYCRLLYEKLQTELQRENAAL